MSKPIFILDTSPLSVLCGFPKQGVSYAHQVLDYAEIALPVEVVGEIGNGKMAEIALPLLRAKCISTVEVPTAPRILEEAYASVLGNGERGVIKASLATGNAAVLDDREAFVIACRFGIQPIGFQDFIVNLTLKHRLPRFLAYRIVTNTARQFPSSYLIHTLDMLQE